MSFRAYIVTASFTSGSKIVTCPGAALTANVYPGCSIKGNDGRQYAIASIDSATQLTLENNYAGSTAASVANTEISRISSGLVSTAQANVKYSQLLEALRRGFTLTSSASLAIGLGTKVFPDVEAGLPILDGIRLEATSRANPANKMRGTCTYSGSTLTMTVPAGGFSGSGTFADWNLNIVGVDGGNAAPPTVQVFSSSGTWTKPVGCKSVRVRVIGGGGSGAGATAAGSQCCAGGGGGAGAFSEGFFDVTATSSVAVTVGAGGAGGAAANGNGGAGGASAFGALLTAPPGTGGGGMASGTAVSIARGGPASSLGAGGSLRVSGNGGGNSFRLDATNFISGQGAPGPYGGSPRGTNLVGAGLAGQGPGAGGAGAGSNSATGYVGGAGAAGLVIVEEFY